MKITKVKIFTLLLVLIAAFVLGACESEEEVAEATEEPAATSVPIEEPYSEHLELYFMPRTAANSAAALTSDDATIAYLEEKYNVTFNIIDTTSDEAAGTYTEILTTLIASADIPDFMDLDVLDTNSSEYEKLVESGIAMDVGTFLEENSEDYPMIESYILNGSSIDKFTSDDGSLYCLPHYVAPDDTVYLVRGDWVEEAGYNLEDIDTLEEFAELMNVFVEEDFDGMDTVGFSIGAEKYLYPIYVGYTGAYIFKEEDGYYTDWYTLYELREALGYIYLMYKTEAFDRDYLNHDGSVSEEKITTGQAGCIATEITNLPYLNETLQENIPDGYLEPLPIDLEGPAGTTRYTDKDNASANVISIYFEDPARIIDMCELIFTEEGKELVLYGVEGVHYSVEDGEIVPDYEAYSEEGFKYNAGGTENTVQSYNEIRNIITNFEAISSPDYSDTSILWYESLLSYTDIISNPLEDGGFDDSKLYTAMTAVKDKWIDNFISGSKLLTDSNWEDFVEEYLEAGAQEQMDFYNGVTEDEEEDEED